MALRGVQALFPDAPPQDGMYESFYLRAVAPEEPVGVWIRYTVHKPPGRPPCGSLWCTVFDLQRERPFMHKLTTDALAVPADGWISVGDAALGPERAEGACGAASWSLRITATEPELRHLPRAWMYRAPLPRTKLSSPAPAARFDGTLVLADAPGQPARTIELRDWVGMVGHNWGSQHAERWIWLHGIALHETPAPRFERADPWLDVAIGRVRIAGATTPWIASGALSLDGQRHRIGGLAARGLLVAETPRHCRLTLPASSGLTIEAHIDAPLAGLAGWRYADPIGDPQSDRDRDARSDPQADPGSPEVDRPENRQSENGRSAADQHDVSNCSIAALDLTVHRPGLPARTLHSAHGAAYELGMREHDHGVPIAPFPDG
jgi:hypothetical protein